MRNLIYRLYTFDFQSKVEEIFVFSLVESLVLVLVIYIIFVIVIYKNILDIERVRSYECGFDPYRYTRLSFSYRFFLISILFIIFDVEISLILPIPFLIDRDLGIWIFVLFILVLILGLIYEIICGSLDWLDIIIKA